MTANLRNLTRKDVKFEWTQTHDEELDKLKYLITHSPTLKIFDSKLDMTIQCDASSEGLGCVLLQEGHPVSFASRTLTKSEKRYAQIEKELLAICFSFEKFHYYVYGHPVVVQSDHKPLVPIFNRDLDKISNRLQRMMLRLLKYEIHIEYLPGRDMLVADILSRSYIKKPVDDDPEMEYVIHSLYNDIPMSDEKKDLFKKTIDNDETLKKVKNYCLTIWPENDNALDNELKFYYKLKDKIYLSNDLLFLETKIIVPEKLRQQMISLIHEPHFGIQKSKSRARQIFYWPCLARDIETFISNCEICQVNKKSNQKETLINHPLPTRAWQYLSSDYFEYENRNYLLIVDSYSNWIEVSETRTKTALEVIRFCKDKFSQFGVPDIFFADNVPYNSVTFKNFAKEWNFEVRFSSPHHHQSNGLAERSVGIVKEMLRKAANKKDLHSLLMEYRTTPLPNMTYSPAQLFLHRILKTKIPTSTESLKPIILDPILIQNKLETKQQTQKQIFDRNAKDLPKLEKGENVLIQKGKVWERGKVEDIVNNRSYLVKDSKGLLLRRNRKFLNKTNLPYINNDSQLYDVDLFMRENLDINLNPEPENAHDDNDMFNRDLCYPNFDLESDSDSESDESFDDCLQSENSDNFDSNMQEASQSEHSFGKTLNKRNRRPPSYLNDYEVNLKADSDSDVS